MKEILQCSQQFDHLEKKAIPIKIIQSCGDFRGRSFFTTVASAVEISFKLSKTRVRVVFSKTAVFDNYCWQMCCVSRLWREIITQSEMWCSVFLSLISIFDINSNFRELLKENMNWPFEGLSFRKKTKFIHILSVFPIWVKENPQDFKAKIQSCRSNHHTC